MKKYPPYPAAKWDRAVLESARMALRKPNKCVCIYCHAQAITEDAVQHVADCPTKDATERSPVVPKRHPDETYREWLIRARAVLREQMEVQGEDHGDA